MREKQAGEFYIGLRYQMKYNFAEPRNEGKEFIVPTVIKFEKCITVQFFFFQNGEKS